MKLTEIVKYFKNNEALDLLFQKYNLDKESECVQLYMENCISANSPIQFFNIEMTNDEIEFSHNGTTYVQLFPLELGVEIYSYFENEFSKNNFTNDQIAKRLIEYRINDA